MRWKPKCSISTHPTFVAIVIRSTGHLCTSIVYTMAELFFGCNTFFFINWTRNIYRQQTKFAKVMFSQVSVCLQRGLCPEGVSVQRYLCPEGVSVQGMSLFRGCLSGGSLSGGLCPGDLCPGGGGSLSRKVTCGRYASYWNTFLFACHTLGLDGSQTHVRNDFRFQ